MDSKILFLVGCIGARLLLTFVAKTQLDYLPYLGYLAMIVSAGFIYVYLTGSRPTGIETGGKPIWWNHIRPIHALFYGLFAYMAIVQQSKDAWKLLLADTAFGFGAFVNHHYLS